MGHRVSGPIVIYIIICINMCIPITTSSPTFIQTKRITYSTISLSPLMKYTYIYIIYWILLDQKVSAHLFEMDMLEPHPTDDPRCGTKVSS